MKTKKSNKRTAHFSRKKTVARGAKKSVKETIKNDKKEQSKITPGVGKIYGTPIRRKLETDNFFWYSKSRNWAAEFRKRITTGIFDPYTNPSTGKPYTFAAQHYRDSFLVIEQKSSPQKIADTVGGSRNAAFEKPLEA